MGSISLSYLIFLRSPQRGSSVACALYGGARGRFDPPLMARKICVSEHTFLSVFAGMTLNECAVLQIWMSSVQGKSPSVQVEELYGNLSRVGVIKIVINCNLITFSKVIACNCN